MVSSDLLRKEKKKKKKKKNNLFPDSLLKIFEGYEIKKKVGAIVSDNAPNAISGSQKAASALASETGHPVFTLRCLPHILHLNLT